MPVGGSGGAAPDAAAHVRLDPEVEEGQRRHDHVKDIGADAPQLAAQGDLAPQPRCTAADLTC